MSPVSLMANPFRDLLQKKPAAEFLHRARRSLAGIAQDFWKDGPDNPFKHGAARGLTPERQARAVMPRPAAAHEWHAHAGEISEKMWGEGFLTPGGRTISDMLVKPLGLTNEMSVLDLSAGLGGRMRRVTMETGVYITGLEPDPGIADRGQAMSVLAGKGRHDVIEHYVPAEFAPGKTVTRVYDCIIARETFYRVQDKQKFFAALAACTKPQAQIAFTDYIVNPEDRDKPAIAAWMAYERGSTPLGLVEMAEAWAKEGFKLRVHDDQTDYYSKEVLAGLKRFAEFLAASRRPDPETRQAILRRMETWTHRLAAMEQGMRFYRFYGTK